jgi:hypothetical protein
MRFDEILCERIMKTISPKMQAEAEAQGFDTTRILYHGTNRRFTGFRLPKTRGYDELGQGVYVTDVKWLANTWARSKGFVLSCYIKKGPLLDLGDREAKMRAAYEGHCLFMDDTFGPDTNSRYDYDDFLDMAKRMTDFNRFLAYTDFVGGYDASSQIRGQIVVFRPENVMIVAREAGE